MRMQLLEETASKVTNFTGFLQEVFQPSTDAVTLEHAARSLGQLVRMGGPLTTDTVETEVSTRSNGAKLMWLPRRRPQESLLAQGQQAQELAPTSPMMYWGCSQSLDSAKAEHLGFQSPCK